MKFTKNTVSFFIFFLSSIFIGNDVFSQINTEKQEYYLTLNKPGRKKRIRFYIGDELKFKLKDEDFKRTAIITAMDSNSITINGVAQIPLEDFRVIHLDKNNALTALSKSGTGTGIVFMILGGITTALKVSKGETMIYGGGVLFITGQFFSIFKKRKYKLNSYRYLRTVPRWKGLDLEKTKSY